MASSQSKTLGTLHLPANFPTGEFDAVNAAVARKSAGGASIWPGFASAWNAVAYRVRAANDHANAFATSVAVSSSPEMEERYQQDHDLFCFAAASLSAIESFHFAAYFMASLVEPTTFKITIKTDLKFYPKDVLLQYQNTFPSDSLTTTVGKCLGAPEYSQLYGVRNVLSHRGTPPRKHYAGSGPDVPSTIPGNLLDLAADWQYSFSLNATCLDPFRNWLNHSIRELIVSADQFAAARL